MKLMIKSRPIIYINTIYTIYIAFNLVTSKSYMTRASYWPFKLSLWSIFFASNSSPLVSTATSQPSRSFFISWMSSNWRSQALLLSMMGGVQVSQPSWSEWLGEVGESVGEYVGVVRTAINNFIQINTLVRKLVFRSRKVGIWQIQLRS